MKKILNESIYYLTGRTLDVLEWVYDRDVKSRKHKPFGG